MPNVFPCQPVREERTPKPVAGPGARPPSTELLGLMTVPPAGPAAASRTWFRQLRMLASEHGLSHCSMGMTGDFEVAIEEVATHIRVGRAIFGERQH